MLWGRSFQLTLTRSNWLEQNFENREELKEMSCYIEAVFGNFCEYFGVTDHLMLQVIFHLQTEQPWNVLQCIFTVVIWTSPTLSLNRSPLWRILLLLNKPVYICTCPCSSARHVLECSDGLWHSADTTNTVPSLFAPAQRMTTANVEFRWQWIHLRMNRETNVIPVTLCMTMNKKIEPQGLCGVQIYQRWEYIFHFLLTCIIVILMIGAFLLIVHSFKRNKIRNTTRKL